MSEKSALQAVKKRFLMLFCLGVSVFIASCATNNVASSGATNAQTITSSSGRTDVATESDEPESRKRARVRMELALGYFEQGKTEIALDELKQALASDPVFGDAYTLRGLVYMRLNDRNLAEDSFRRALNINPRDGNAAHNYAWLLCQERRYEDAQKLFEQAASNPLYSDRAKTYLARGICYSRAGDDANAERALGRAFEVDAGNPVAGYNLATLLFRRGDFVRAQFYLKRLNASADANEETLWLGAKAEMRLNNFDAANELGSQLVRKYPKSRQAQSYQRRAFSE